jgi:hypothetical protein
VAVCLAISAYGFFKHEDALFGHRATTTEEIPLNLPHPKKEVEERRKPEFKRKKQAGVLTSFINRVVKPQTHKEVLKYDD